MGTWSASILGNDLTCDLKEAFFERYNKGEDVSVIKKELLLQSLW